MLTPAYRLVIGEKAADTTHDPAESTAVDVDVHLDMDTPADRFVIVLGQVGGIKPARDDNASVSLGYADDGGLTRVINGKIVQVDRGLLTTRIVGFTAADALLRTFVNKTFESKSAGAIVRDLAGQANVDVDAADDGITFPAYVVESQRSVYHHMRALADLCGFDLYVNASGKLVFERFVNGKTVHVFEFAKDILALDVVESEPFAARVEAWGESPTGSSGGDAWGWLTSDFSSSKGSAGSGDPLLLLERPVLRTKDAATTAASAAQTAIARRVKRGELLSLGRPAVLLGDAISVRSAPDGALNANYQVRSIRHRVTKSGGFTTLVGFRAI